MKKHILNAAILATGALALSGMAQAATVRDNNTDGVAQYQRFEKRYHEQMDEQARYKPMASESDVGKPAHQKIGGNMMGNMNDIEPAAGGYMKEAHEDSMCYNQ